MKTQRTPISNVDDEQQLALLERVANGDKDALTRLYSLYHARLFNFVFRLTASYSTADELVNDIMLVVWDKADTFRGDSKVSTWIFGIAYKQAMRRIAKRRLRILSFDDHPDETGRDDDRSTEIENWVENALCTLPAAQQLTVVLVFYLGLTYEETAQVTDCPVNTVKTRMFHARRKLRDYLSASAVPDEGFDGVYYD